MDSRVRTTMTTEGEVNVMRGIQDMSASTKRKEDPSSSNPGKKQKTSVSQGYPGQGQGHQDQGQDGTFSQAGQMMCCFCHSLDTFNGIVHEGRNPKVMGHLNPNHQRDGLGLPVRTGIWCATIASSPDI